MSATDKNIQLVGRTPISISLCLFSLLFISLGIRLILFVRPTIECRSDWTKSSRKAYLPFFSSLAKRTVVESRPCYVKCQPVASQHEFLACLLEDSCDVTAVYAKNVLYQIHLPQTVCLAYGMYGHKALTRNFSYQKQATRCH